MAGVRVMIVLCASVIIVGVVVRGMGMVWLGSVSCVVSVDSVVSVDIRVITCGGGIRLVCWPMAVVLVVRCVGLLSALFAERAPCCYCQYRIALLPPTWWAS